MLLYELFQLPLTELRRNPVQNIKEIGHKAAVKFLKDAGKDIRDYGISMTKLPKLGINPGSNYNTPVGIYFYPAEFYMRLKDKDKERELPFMDDALYIQIFELHGNIENIDELPVSHFNSYIAKLFKNLNKIAQLTGLSEINAEKKLSRAIINSGSEAKDNSYGGKLWYILYFLSRTEDGEGNSVGKRDNAAPRSSVIWNSLLRMLGMDGVIDTGAGIIHKNEPYQGVILNPRSISHVKSIPNTPAKKVDATGNMFANLASMKVDDQYIENVVQYVKELDLEYDAKYKKFCSKVVNNVLNVLRNNPNIYRRLDISDIRFILGLTKDPAVFKELTVGYYASKFPKIKKAIDEMLEDWEYAKSSTTWNELPEVRKARQFEMVAPQYKRDQAAKIIRDLTPFKSEPGVAEIIKYLTDALAILQFEYIKA